MRVYERPAPFTSPLLIIRRSTPSGADVEFPDTH